MQLKMLNYCLMAAALCACQSTVTKTNSQSSDKSSDLAYKSIQGVNALYENPSYNYRGQLQLGFDKTAAPTELNLAQTQQQVAEQEKVQQKLQQLFKQLQPTLPLSLQRQLLQSAQNPKADPANNDMMNLVIKLLQDLNFRYDGTVHLDEKIASLNFTTDYNKANFKVQAKVGAVLDLKQQRLYTDYFGLAPLVVGPNAKSDWLYLDFSEFKQQLNQIDLKALVAYLKASGAVSYELASPQQLEQVALDPALQQAGAVEQIRHRAYVDEALLQSLLFERVNRQYFLQQILHLDAMKALADSSPDHSPSIDLNASNSSQAEQAAKAIMQVKYAQLLKIDDTSTEVDADATATKDDHDAKALDETNTLASCEQLKADPKAAYGQLQNCLNDDPKLLQTVPDQPDNALFNDTQQALVERFAQYDQGKFIDEKAFAALWRKHLAEIQAVAPLPAQRSSINVDLALDAQGRMVAMRYDLAMPLPELQRKMQLKGDLWISQYGKATPIAMQPLRAATDLLKIDQKSTFNKWLKLTTDLKADGKTSAKAADWAQLAAQRYDQTQSYVSTYQTVFLAQLAQQKPELLLRFSNNDLNEVAQVYAYWFSDEEIYDPKDTELKRIEMLQEKHQLIDEAQFDNTLGAAVNALVQDAQNSSAERIQWQKLQQQYRKQPEMLFSQRYVALMLDQEPDLSAPEKADLQTLAHALGQSYLLSRKNKPLDNVLNRLTAAQLEWLDPSIYQQSYTDVLNAIASQ